MKRHVSIVIPALDEASYITACVASTTAQEADGATVEVIVADGGSTDGTPDLARASGATVIDNPDRTIPAALNRLLAAAKGDVLIRFDAHAEMPPGYVRACLAALDAEPAAANVGGWRQPVGRTAWGRACGAALASPAGVGNARIWRRPRDAARQYVDTVPLGCFRIDRLRAVQGWREDLLANEDYDLNFRLRSAGSRVVFDPAIWSFYHPRESLPAIARQYWRYGRWKAVMLADAPTSLQPRQLAPVGLVATLALAPFARPARAAAVGYGAMLTIETARTRGGWRVAPVLAVMHLAWAAGLLTRVAELAARHTRRE